MGSHVHIYKNITIKVQLQCYDISTKIIYITTLIHQHCHSEEGSIDSGTVHLSDARAGGSIVKP